MPTVNATGAEHEPRPVREGEDKSMVARSLNLSDRGDPPTVDFIVVGVGPAGCAVVARLAQSS